MRPGTSGTALILCAVMVFFTISSDMVSASELRRTAVVEFPFDDEPVFYYPVDLLCRGDSLRAVVNRGDGTIVVMNDEWDVLRRFGRLGEGPGELTSPTALLSWDDTLWTVTPQNLVGYTWDGRHAGNRRIPWGITSLHCDGQTLVGTWTGGSRGGPVGVVLSRSGEVLDTFGPRCAARRTGDIEGFALCMGWSVLQQAGGEHVLVNHYEGDVLIFREKKPSRERKHLGIGRGEMLSDWSYRSVINDVCTDPAGGYWVLTYKADGRSRLIHFDRAWDMVVEYRLAPDTGQGAIRVLPHGDLCLVEEKASRLHVFARPSL